MYRKLSFLIFFVALLGLTSVARATDFTSSNFINRDPVVNVAGGQATSTSFQIFSDVGEVVIGESSSTNFMSWAGFLYFSAVTTPVVSATAGDAAATVSWTAAAGSLGYNVTAYEVGQSTVSGGPYSYTNVGSVLSSARSGLTNGTVYYFVVRALDYYAVPITTSSQVSATPVAAAVSPPASSGGGGGGGGGPPPAPVQTTVVFSGRAYPGSTVTLMKDAQVVATTISGPTANFLITLTSLTAGNFIFSLYSEDNKGNRSSLVTFPVGITSGATTNVSGIFLAPTIAVDKSEVKQGDDIAIFGQSTPVSDIMITVNSDVPVYVKTKADSNGIYLYNFDTTPLEYGQHLAKSKASLNGEISGYSRTVGFLVSNKNITTVSQTCDGKADMNSDCKVNLVDFSIAAYWYKRPLSNEFKLIEKAKLNGDALINLVDLSIMAYHWTG